MATEEETKAFFEDAKRMSELLGVPPSVLENLAKADDWSFVVQAHCIVEICINRILEREIVPGTWRAQGKKEALNNFWPTLPLVGRSGRLKLIKELNLLPKDYCDFAEELARLRNAYCHDARKLAVPLADMISGSDANATRARKVRLFLGSDPDHEDFAVIFQTAPKAILWMSLMSLLGISYKFEKMPSPIASLLGLGSPS